jgi:predicted ATPase
MNESESKKGITKISVSGFKSLVNECSIEIRPLTILAGANSSGKSSIMQPLLLMKQTLESSTDYGALRLDGDNLKFTSANQFLSFLPSKKQTSSFTIEVELADSSKFKDIFTKLPNQSIELGETIYYLKKGEEIKASVGMTSRDIFKGLPQYLKIIYQAASRFKIDKNTWEVVRYFCFNTFVVLDIDYQTSISIFYILNFLLQFKVLFISKDLEV